MGLRPPSALGAQAANPGKLVIDIDGDGSFVMNIQELACAFCEKLPVKVLLINNQHLGMVVQWEDRFFQGNRASYLPRRGRRSALSRFRGPGSRVPCCGAARVSVKEDLDAPLKK